MASFDAILGPATERATKITNLASGASSTSQTVGERVVVAMVADGDMHVRFGSSSSIGDASASDFYIPSKSAFQVDIGTLRGVDRFRVFNPTAGNINVYFWVLSRT